MARAASGFLLQPDRIDELFRRTAETQYTRNLLFSHLVQLMAAVVLRTEPSLLAAYKRRVGEIPASDQAVYDKLQRIEPRVSQALVRYAHDQAAQVIDSLGDRDAPLLSGYRCRFLDGCHLNATQRRIKELRNVADGPLPGTALVVLDQETQTAADVFLTQDGHAQERSLLDEVLQTVRERDLWIADRNFCTIGFMKGIDDRNATFVIRQHGQLKGELRGDRRYVGRVEGGAAFEQKLDLPWQGSTFTVRRITIELDEPTRDGDVELHLLTNLPVEAADAARVAGLYRRRWSIEGVFLEITQTMECEPNTLGYPRAALFAFCLALTAHAGIRMVKAGLRAAHGVEAVAETSAYTMALEISRTEPGMLIAAPETEWAVYSHLSAGEMAAELKRMAAYADLKRYRKSKRGPKKKPPIRTRHSKGGHVSTYKMIKDKEK